MTRPQLRIRDLLWLTVLVAVVAGWWLDRRREATPMEIHPLPTDLHGGGTLTFYNYAFGQRYLLELADPMFQETPKWLRRPLNPPVSANDAMVLADQARQAMIRHQKLEENDCWTLTGAELRPYSPGNWYWCIRFEAWISQSGPPHEIEFVVLMDGTVVEPTLEFIIGGSDISDVQLELAPIVDDVTLPDS